MHNPVITILLLIKLNKLKNTGQFLSRTPINYVPCWQLIVDALLLIYFLILLLGCPTANFGPLSRRKPRLLDVNTALFKFWVQGDQEPCKKGWFSKLGLTPSGVWAGKRPILSQRLKPLCRASWFVVIKLQLLSLFTLTSVYNIFQNYNIFKFIFTFPFIKHSEVSYFVYSVDTAKRLDTTFKDADELPF